MCAMMTQHFREKHSVGRDAPYWELQPRLQRYIFDHPNWQVCNTRKIAFGIRYLQPAFGTAMKKVRILLLSTGYILIISPR